VEASGHAKFEVPSWHLPGEPKKQPQSGQMHLDQDFNAGPLEKEYPLQYSLLSNTL
jgi:hypothetical protein